MAQTILELDQRLESAEDVRDGLTNPVTLLSQIVLAISMGLLLFLFAADASPALLAPILMTSYGVTIALTCIHYIEHGRILATPAFILFGILVLYTVPVVFFDMIMNYPSYCELARSGLLMAIAMAIVAFMLLAFDRPRPLPGLARWVETRHLLLRQTSYVLMAIGWVWLFLSFQSFSALYKYLFESSYYEKHIYFEGSAALGMFSICFELAGMCAALAIAIPAARRQYGRALDLVPLLMLFLFMVNQGKRSSIVWVFCQYFVARSFWPRSGIRITTLAAWLSVLAPMFLIWAFVRINISTEGLFNTHELGKRVEESDWTNLHESEIACNVSNGRHLLELLDSGTWNFRWGSTMMLDPIIALIPRALWPDRPDALQIAFTRAVDPWYPEGGTLAFSFVLEGYLNFGIFGTIAWSALVAWSLIGLLDVAERKAQEGSWLLCLGILILNSQIWFYIRDDFGDLIRHCFVVLFLMGVTAGLTGSVATQWARGAARFPAPG
jgi:hypothetical protein